MTEWKKIYISESAIKASTHKVVLIAMPGRGRYSGYCFWHPSKLVRDCEHRNMVSVSYTEEFKFYLRKRGRNQYRKSGNPIEISAAEFEKEFSGRNVDFPEEPLIYTPELIEPEGATADESLIDED